MTREEALYILKNNNPNEINLMYGAVKYIEALNMAIEALELTDDKAEMG